MRNNLSNLFLSSIAIAAPAILNSCKPNEESKTERPNVILVLTDDQGYGDLSVHGNPVLKTPELDKLHAQSVRFTDFHSSPMCSPTRGQLLTGVDAVRNGCTAVCMGRSMVNSELPSIADIFKASGYQTAHFGKWHMGDSYPYRPQDRGFDETIHHGAWGITSIADYFGNSYWKGKFSHNEELIDYEGYCTDVLFNYTMDYIDKWEKGDKPFFVYLPTNCPHSPHLCDDKYSDPYIKLGIDTVISKFFGQIVNIDENMGRLVKFLDEKGIAENTILLYLSDNGTVKGETIYNAGMRGKKTYPFEGGHRIPFFVRWPKGNIGEPRDIDLLAEVQDILPTLIDWCGLTKPENAKFDGSSLAPVFEDNINDLDDRILVVQYDNPWNEDNSKCVMWKKWRLVRLKELYDISIDPGQQNDVSADYPDIVKKLKDYYDQWYAEAVIEYNKVRYIHLGNKKQNPLMLFSSDWKGGYADNDGNLNEGTAIGYWDVEVETAGTYEFTLSRWHPASKWALTAYDEKAHNGKDSGRPIAKARLKVGDFDKTVETTADQNEVKFTVELTQGKHKIETWFLDKDGIELCSAFYTNTELLK